MKFNKEEYKKLIALGPEKIAEFWIMYSSKIDFANPINSKWYIDAIENYLGNITAFQSNYNNQKNIFSRARLNLSPQTLFSNINQLLCAPNKRTKVGRANLPHKPVFYCSNAPGTSILEIRPKLGDWITSLEINILKSELSTFALGIDPKENIFYDELSIHDRGINLFFNSIFTEKVEKPEDYFKTAIIIEKYKNIKDCVVFPSVASKAKGFNFVFQKNFISNFGEFKKATVHEVIEYNDESDMKLKCVWVCHNKYPNGDLHWVPVINCPLHEINDKLYDEEE